ncbi:MAG TPA: carboxymuconolactone decarboxylase family protein [Stellaceae bacterium]|nr:carboxymuconolactone decarboxylase family protein [Stellaceae bacterium]
MPRAPELDPTKLTEEQSRVFGEIQRRLRSANPTAAVRGPFAVLLNAPHVAEGAIRAYSSFREGKIERRLFELMILVVARNMTAQYEWFAHAPHAIAAGITPEAVEAIRNRRTPILTREDERMVYDVATELCTARTLSQSAYDRAHAILGLEQLIELIAGTGFYIMIATVLNAFDVAVPGNEKLLP